MIARRELVLSFPARFEFQTGESIRHITLRIFYISPRIAQPSAMLYFVAHPCPGRNAAGRKGRTEEAGAVPGILGWQARFSEVGLSRNGVFGKQTGFE
jgi:hypothetical protein